MTIATKTLHQLTVLQARAALRAGEITAVQLTQALINRITAVEHQVKAFLTTTPEQALEQAAEADRRRAEGDDAPLLGIPLAI